LADHAPITRLRGFRTLSLEMSNGHCEIVGHLALRDHHADLINANKIQMDQLSIRPHDVSKYRARIRRKPGNKRIAGRGQMYLQSAIKLSSEFIVGQRRW
jgi:hypothetical protein